jgi:hypothetical protein
MKRSSGRRKLVRWAVLLGALGFVAFVVERSLRIAGYQCTVCMSFAGREMCRTVEAATAMDARSGAINNACALLASGVTDTMACERSGPVREDCSALN